MGKYEGTRRPVRREGCQIGSRRSSFLPGSEASATIRLDSGTYPGLQPGHALYKHSRPYDDELSSRLDRLDAAVDEGWLHMYALIFYYTSGALRATLYSVLSSSRLCEHTKGYKDLRKQVETGYFRARDEILG